MYCRLLSGVCPRPPSLSIRADNRVSSVSRSVTASGLGLLETLVATAFALSVGLCVATGDDSRSQPPARSRASRQSLASVR